MAIIPIAKYPGQVASDPTNYPYGKARNVTAEGDGVGTPLEQDWINDLWGFLQAILHFSGTTPAGVPDSALASDYLVGLTRLFADRKNQIVTILPLTHAGGLDQSNSSSTPTTVTGGGFGLNVQAGDILEIHYGPIWASSAGITGSYAGLLSLEIQEDSTGSRTPTKLFTSNILGNTTSPITRSLVYTCTKSGALAGYLLISNQLGVDTHVTTNQDPDFGFVKLIRPLP